MLGLAIIQILIDMYEEALSNYSHALSIVEENGLFNFLKVINEDLKTSNENIEIFSEKKDEELNIAKQK